MFLMKLCQRDEKVWEDGTSNKTYQFGIIGKVALLCIIVDDDNPSPYRGINILTSFLSPSHLFSIDIQVKGYTLSLNALSEHFGGWGE
jgi:hypothetical protein